jgi:hypothetical protein
LPAAARSIGFLVSAAVLNLLAERAEDAPLLCVVDDAHWLDEPSTEALVCAARRLQTEAIAVLFAVWEGGVRGFEARGPSELRLDGLDAVAAELLAAERAVGVPPRCRVPPGGRHPRERARRGRWAQPRRPGWSESGAASCAEHVAVADER